MKRLMAAVVLAALHLAALPGLSRAQAPPQAGDSKPAAVRDFKADTRALAQKIDRLIAKSWQGTDIKPAPPSVDTQFLRRLHLDLAGRIPELTAVRDFLDDDRPNKREL